MGSKNVVRFRDVIGIDHDPGDNVWRAVLGEVMFGHPYFNSRSWLTTDKIVTIHFAENGQVEIIETLHTLYIREKTDDQPT